MKKLIFYLLLSAAVCLLHVQSAASYGTGNSAHGIVLNFTRLFEKSVMTPETQASDADTISTVLSLDTSWYMIAAPSAWLSYGDLLNNVVTQGYEGSTYPERQPNILWFDETDTLTSLMSWRAPQSQNETIAHGRGHYLFVFGNIPLDSLYNDQLPVYLKTSTDDVFTGDQFTWNSNTFPVTFTPRTGLNNPEGVQGNIHTETSLADEGWNLLGNPTPHTLDWGSASGWTKTHIDSAIYIWNAAEKTFNFFNGITGTHSGLIPPFQAFWVRANGTNPQLAFNDEVFTTGGEFQKPEDNSRTWQTDDLHISLQLSGSGMHAECIISFTEAGITGYDPADAYRLEPLSSNHLDLFSLSSPGHAVPLAINHLPRYEQEYFNLPLHVYSIQNRKAESDLLVLEWQLPDNWPENWAVSLHDHTLQKAISMNDFGEYTFYSDTEYSWNYSGKTSPAERIRLFSPVDNQGIQHRQSQAPFSIIIQKGIMPTHTTYIKPAPALLPTFPNPFSGVTNLAFTLPETHHVKLEVYDLYGRRITILAQGEYPPGIHRLKWDSTGLSSGIYILRLTTGVNQDVKKLQIVNH